MGKNNPGRRPARPESKEENGDRPTVKTTNVSAENRERLEDQALEKYKELYAYSTDVLVKEQDRFVRADEKASKYSTILVFQLGIVGFFGNWILGKFGWPDFPVGLPSEWPLFAVGLLALISCTVGWFLTNQAIMLRPYVGRPLNTKVLQFFRENKLIDIYNAYAKSDVEAYETTKKATNQKFATLLWVHRLMFLNTVLLGELILMYCLYSWL